MTTRKIELDEHLGFVNVEPASNGFERNHHRTFYDKIK